MYSFISKQMKNIFLTLLTCFGLTTWAQSKKAKIVDKNGNPIENVYVLNTKSQTHAHSNEFGVFTLSETVDGDPLEIVAFGYKRLIRAFNSNEEAIVLEDGLFRLKEVVIQPKLSAMNVISKIDLQTSPVNSSQEILRKVPGLFIGQHAGGGKAEQLFLRGFDIDHGTDIAISVDGMPVNMVSHAHGQGYADLHFVIPETVDKIDFGKGTYYADKGDFATAGYVAFQTKDKIENSSIGVEIGQFNTLRTVGLFDLLGQQKNQSAYIATEYILTDGPFDAPQNFNRINLLGKYSVSLNDASKFSILASRFKSKWDASGQIPQRLVDLGVITRFGAVDSTEGGTTSRTNFNVAWSKPISENSYFKANAFYSNYEFELFSNFTFFLNDPVNGDQIKQKEERAIYGLNADLHQKSFINDAEVLMQYGIGFRSDATIDSELSSTLNRKTVLQRLKLGDIEQSNLFSYANAEFKMGKWIINPALRLDYFKFNYQDKLANTFQTQAETEVKFSPKLNFIYSKSNELQFFVKSGMGFHSNDTRVVVENNGREILPTAIGTDIGTIWKPTPSLLVNAALWHLYLDQEFVYVGDAGVIEPSGKSRRMGAELSLRYQLNDHLFFDADANYTYARSIEELNGQDFIPLAPDFTTTGGLSFQNVHGFSGGLRYRYLKNRPANEDNSIIAKGYFISDLNVNYQLKKINIGITIENIFNTEWNETQFATESRLQNEPESVEEIHFTPGTPFFLKGKITYAF